MGVFTQLRCATLSSPHVPSPPRPVPAGFVRGHNGPSGPIVAVQSRGTPGRGRGQPRFKPARPPPRPPPLPCEGARCSRLSPAGQAGTALPAGRAGARQGRRRPQPWPLRPGPARPPGACAAPPPREAEAQARVSAGGPLGGGGRPFNGRAARERGEGKGGGGGGLSGENGWSPGSGSQRGPGVARPPGGGARPFRGWAQRPSHLARCGPRPPPRRRADAAGPALACLRPPAVVPLGQAPALQGSGVCGPGCALLHLRSGGLCSSSLVLWVSARGLL